MTNNVPDPAATAAMFQGVPLRAHAALFSFKAHRDAGFGKKDLATMVRAAFKQE